MYKETSIQLGIFRKKEKDSVIIEGEEYVIEQLLPLDVFFFRICMNKLLEKGDMKLLTIPVDENGDTNRNEFLNSLKELIGDDKDSDWIKDYIDLSSVPAPFYMYKRFVRIT
ncbi:MAG: hypothetical protein SPI09_06045 [Candidatus Limivicinus sp.]|nr:hypothetical protein [Clostridiales bacterium]MDY6132906.1 hypothetical protein [Candidatus Limivicinus sp.]